jgi:hypothetical protein
MLSALKRNDNWIFAVSIAAILAGGTIANVSLYKIRQTLAPTSPVECWHGMQIGSNNRC